MISGLAAPLGNGPGYFRGMMRAILVIPITAKSAMIISPAPRTTISLPSTFCFSSTFRRRPALTKSIRFAAAQSMSHRVGAGSVRRDVGEELVALPRHLADDQGSSRRRQPPISAATSRAVSDAEAGLPRRRRHLVGHGVVDRRFLELVLQPEHLVEIEEEEPHRDVDRLVAGLRRLAQELEHARFAGEVDVLLRGLEPAQRLAEQRAAGGLDVLQLGEIEPQLRLLLGGLLQLVERGGAGGAEHAAQRDGGEAAGAEVGVLARDRGRRIDPHRRRALELDHEVERLFLELGLATELLQHVEQHQPHLQLPGAQVLAVDRLLRARPRLLGLPVRVQDRGFLDRRGHVDAGAFLDFDAEDRVERFLQRLLLGWLGRFGGLGRARRGRLLPDRRGGERAEVEGERFAAGRCRGRSA